MEEGQGAGASLLLGLFLWEAARLGGGMGADTTGKGRLAGDRTGFESLSKLTQCSHFEWMSHTRH